MTGLSRGARLAAHSAVSTALARHSDRSLGALLSAAAPLAAGIGGTSALLDVDGTRVFVKRVPLTDLELRHARSTANLFALPAFCHYGIGIPGGPGFGAWRELAAHTMTTGWVLAGDVEGFPLLHHWRVLPHPGQSLPEELSDVDRAVAYWGGGPAVRHRIEALRDASASVALFLEYIPHNLHEWLPASDAGALAMVERQLAAGVSVMNARGLLHLDAHFQNILTDGERLYFADFGLAMSSRFDLSPDEAAFFAAHQSYDRHYTVTHLVIWLVAAHYGLTRDERHAFIRACAEGTPPAGVPPHVAAVITRHAPTAAVMTDFYRRFQQDSRQTPYPFGS